MLVPKASNIIDAPTQTLWVKGPFGSKYQGREVIRRDPVLGFQIYGSNFRTWREIDSMFRMSWDYELEGRLEFNTEDGSRDIGLRLLSEPKAYENDSTNGFDPHLTCDATLAVNAAAEDPYYSGELVVQEFVIPAKSGSVPNHFWMENDGDVDVWPSWTVSSVAANTKYTIPDFSFGSEEYGRGVADAAKTVPLPKLMAGEHIEVLTEPDEEYLTSSIDTNPWARTEGKDAVYPIPRGTPRTTVPFAWENATVGDVVRLKFRRKYSRPWGVTT